MLTCKKIEINHIWGGGGGGTNLYQALSYSGQPARGEDQLFQLFSFLYDH